ncbi:MAG TPA: MbcA/ParS/Xre antitoxin family protein [Acetobacteraceae bacterium]|nr:MbcA/ParS/Xre antitoxin family protein [Acetobacteraceae bacterium]
MPALIAKPPAKPALTRDQIRNAVAGFFRITDLWGADNAQVRAMLGHPAERTFYKWRAGEVGAVPMDVVRRIGYVSGIWKALQILYSDHVQADGWVRRPHRHFGGQTPLERMSAGDVTDLAAVRQYLDAARGPWS